MIITESNGLETNVYKLTSDEDDFNRSYKRLNQEKFFFLKNLFMVTFLPQGYPQSVSSDYLKYQLWDSIQAFCSGIMGTLATHSVLKGAGVGDATATPLAATITWLLKDGTGMVGRICFAWLQGTKFDADCKKWRIFADVVNDAATLLELSSGYAILLYTPIICVAGLAKALVGVAGGATRAAVAQHQAKRNNMADISAKDSSQETMVNLMSLICSLIFLPYVATNVNLVWTIFFILTFIHIYANIEAVKSLHFNTLNEARLKLLVSTFLQTKQVETVEIVNKQEPIWFCYEDVHMNLGTCISHLVQNFQELEELQELYDGHDYLLNLYIHTGLLIPQSEIVKMPIVLTTTSKPETQIEAIFQACLLREAMANPEEFGELGKVCSEYLKGSPSRFDCLRLSLEESKELMPEFLEKVAKNGWRLDTGVLGVNEWRVAFK